jgi:hypothetical protein
VLTIQILSDEASYALLKPLERRAISNQMREEASEVFQSGVDNVGAFWAPPFERASASGMRSYQVEVEFSDLVGVDALEKLAEIMLRVLGVSPHIPSMTRLGVRIKNPYVSLWRQVTKPYTQ